MQIILIIIITHRGKLGNVLIYLSVPIQVTTKLNVSIASVFFYLIAEV